MATMGNETKQERLPEHEAAAKMDQDFNAMLEAENGLRQIRSVLLERVQWIENVIDANERRRRGDPQPGAEVATGFATPRKGY